MQSNLDRERKVANILETYFSDTSLLWDKVVLNKILTDPEAMIPFDTLCKLLKFKSIEAASEEIKASAKKHSLSKLKMNDAETKIGRIKPYIVNKKQELDEWSIYVEGLEKPNDNEHTISELFNSLVGHVSFFRIPPNQHGSTQFFGYCFIEFDNKDNVEKAVRVMDRYNKKSNTPQADENTKRIDKLNLRVMSKLDWIKYKDEYVQLLNTRKEKVKRAWDEFYEEYPEGQYEEKQEKPFIEGITVFVDGLDLKCSKTTATKLLETSTVHIDFMNTKKKGLSTTHIRLNNPQDAKQITDYFTVNHIIQETPQDVVGKKVDTPGFNCLKLRIIQGREEELYWENESKHMGSTTH